jgi:signal transduction histidine kinase
MDSGATGVAGPSTADGARSAVASDPHASLVYARRVAASVAEELSQPVTSLLLKLELIRAEAGDCDCGEGRPRGDELQALHRNVGRLVHLIELLRCYAGDGAASPRPARLNDIVARAHTAAGLPDVALVMDPSHPLIIGDAVLLERFVTQVLIDASRTSPDPHAVRVETATPGADREHVTVLISGVSEVPGLADAIRRLLSEHPGTLDARTTDDRLVLALPRVTLQLPGLADARPRDVTDIRSTDRAGLERVVHALRDAFDVSEQAQRITESVLPLFHARSAITWLKEPNGALACVAAATENPARVTLVDVLPRRADMARRAVAERRALWEVEAPERGAELCAVLAAPLIVKGEVFGAVVTEHGEPWGNVPARMERMRVFAGYIAPAMRNVQLFECAKGALAHTEAASRSKDEFLAVLAHEFRNSLVPIVTSAAVIRRTAGSGGIVQDSVDVVKRQARHLERLLDDLRDLSRIAQGGIELSRQPVSLAAAVAEAVESIRPLADLGGVGLSVSVSAVPLWVEADATRLKQIIDNILGNAVKYTPSGGRVDVTVDAEGGEGVVRVLDTGIGIAHGMLPHVFDLFVRSDHARAHTRDGVGVGLTLVRHLVALHGGRVAARSDGPGRGAEFMVRLPLSTIPAPPTPVTEAV